MIVKRLFSEN